MPKAIMYTTAFCPYCVQAERLLRQQGLAVEKIPVDKHPEQLQHMIASTRRRTVPQIFIEGHHIGGFTELSEFIRSGRLSALLEPDENL